VADTDRGIAAIGNAVLVFVTFLASVPAIVLPMTRGWLKLHGYMVVVCALYTMILGLSIWFETLKTRSNLFKVWTSQPAATQSLIQQEVSSHACCLLWKLIATSSNAVGT
jgi:protein-S-isoprenylcysteine O-methyltransferase Ste14